MVAVIIPALNEEQSIGIVIDSVRDVVDHMIVVDNGSSDRTAEIARLHGATVVYEPQRGYGAACLRGIEALRESPGPRPGARMNRHSSFVLFLDADASDHPDDARAIIRVMQTTDVEMCLGSRTTGLADAGSLTPQQRFGNWLSTRLISLIWGVHYTDLGPLRAVRWDVLERLEMQDRTWGWTVEMQIKIAMHGISFLEIPVRYRRRIGQSKISGTVVGSVRAGYKILTTIARFALRR
ncbi:MAG: glycosyltransferase family 2 protein [Bacteroidota bacterium]|jgi:glycosyltransferase involved in cell wall biosynthesis